jgi:prolyl oligopeptidase
MNQQGGVSETLHGVEVADPWWWLEDSDDPRVAEWEASQEKRTRAALDNLPGRDALREKLAPWFEVTSVVNAKTGGDRVFFELRGGGRNQPLIMYRDGIGEGIALDPLALRPDGQLAVDWWYPSPDGRFLAYGTSLDGSELSALRIRDLATNEDLSETIPYTRASSVAWLPGSEGFVYTRYATPGTVPEGEEQFRPFACLHRLGSPVGNDAEVFAGMTGKGDMLRTTIDPAGRWVVATIHHGWTSTTVYVSRLLPDSLDFRAVSALEGATSSSVGFDGDWLLVLTDHDAPNGKIVAIDLTGEALKPEQIVETGEELVIESAALALDRLVIRGLRRGQPYCPVHAITGELLSLLELPNADHVFALTGDVRRRRVLVGYESFVRPPMVHEIDIDSGESRPLAVTHLPDEFDPDDCVVTRAEVASRDGTKVPMALAHHRDRNPDQPSPAFLTGYGGFAITRGAEFYPAIPAFLAAGGVIAGPGLRGGYEFGERWHRDGKLERKQNVFDDFIASAEWLIGEGYTTPARLAIGGGSNGGLLVGAAMTQRPDLFRAVWCAVPLLDMVRFHLFRIGHLWVSEYGSPDDPEAFRYLHAYSPYHRVNDGVDYPAVLVTAAASDARVDPMHARKMVARLQEALGERPDRPILLRMETGAGHGAGKSTARKVAEAVDQWSFLRWQLGMQEDET